MGIGNSQRTAYVIWVTDQLVALDIFGHEHALLCCSCLLGQIIKKALYSYRHALSVDDLLLQQLSLHAGQGVGPHTKSDALVMCLQDDKHQASLWVCSRSSQAYRRHRQLQVQQTHNHSSTAQQLHNSHKMQVRPASPLSR